MSPLVCLGRGVRRRGHCVQTGQGRWKRRGEVGVGSSCAGSNGVVQRDIVSSCKESDAWAANDCIWQAAEVLGAGSAA